MTNPNTKGKSKGDGGFPAFKLTYRPEGTVVYVGGGGRGQGVSETNPNTLKPCPFCGEFKTFLEHGHDKKFGWVSCICGARGPTIFLSAVKITGNTWQADSEIAWNTRTECPTSNP